MSLVCSRITDAKQTGNLLSKDFKMNADIRHIVQRRLLSIPPAARAAYHAANAELQRKLSRKGDAELDVNHPSTKAASIVVNASVSDRLANAIEQAREAKRTNSTTTGDGRKTTFDKDSDSLAQAILEARAKKTGN
jgi:hypothetical protein